MEDFEIVGLLLLTINLLVSYKGLTNPQFLDRHAFRVEHILLHKEWGRLISSGFLHASWLHLLFNMMVLHSFGYALETQIGALNFALIWGLSLLGGNLLSLWINRNNAGYSAVGASGAICGIIFAQICLDPAVKIGFIGIPYAVPGWLFGLCYVLFCIWGISTRRGNIGHDAHLGGGLSGIFVALVLIPGTMESNYAVILPMLLPALGYLLYIIIKPEVLIIGSHRAGNLRGHRALDEFYYEQKKKREQKLDLLLDKINERGIDSLSEKEKEFLDNYASTRERF